LGVGSTACALGYSRVYSRGRLPYRGSPATLTCDDQRARNRVTAWHMRSSTLTGRFGRHWLSTVSPMARSEALV
jgi:hypothetical protein